MAKRISHFILIGIALWGMSLTAKVKIDKIEYTKLNGYAQLFLPTHQILPIPETIYPDPANHSRVVMRIRDAECLVDARTLKYDATLIQNIQINNGTNYSDIEIMLKREVAARLFSDQEGLYIEFPLESEAGAEDIPPPSAPVSLNSSVKGGMVLLKDVRLVENTDTGIIFELQLSGKADFSSIPIPDRPARLAIDLKNTTAKAISKSFNTKNVKGVRGARHSASVYRVVFDLDQLGQYKVKALDQAVRVAFYQGTPPAEPAATPAAPLPSQPAAEPQASPPANSNVTIIDSTVPPADKPDSPTPAEAGPTYVRLQTANGKIDIPRAKEQRKEFFGEEKAPSTPPKPVPGTGSVTMQDEKGTQTSHTYITQTVEEGRPKYSGEPYDFSFKNTDLIDVLKFIARTANLNIAIDSSVGGKVTCEFTQVPWDQALDIFLKLNNLDMLLEGNVLRIGPVEKLADEASKRRKLQDARAEEQPLMTVTRAFSYGRAEEVAKVLMTELSKRGNIIIDNRTNQIIISDVPDKIAAIDKLINILDIANPQVQIEARIVEVLTDYLNTFGIQWGYDLINNSAWGNQTNFVFPNNIFSGGYVPEGQPPNKYTFGSEAKGFAINAPTADTAMYPFLRLGNIAGTFNLDVALSGMERHGKGKIISAPKTTTQSLFKATIQQGEKIPIQTIQNNTYSTQYINATLLMEVTPQITARGSIILYVKVANDIANFEKQINGMPTINTEQAETTVMVQDGGTIAIGGMYKLQQSSVTTGVPLLGRLPLLGNLFRSSRKSNEQRELVIFLTPRILK